MFSALVEHPQQKNIFFALYIYIILLLLLLYKNFCFVSISLFYALQMLFLAEQTGF